MLMSSLAIDRQCMLMALRLYGGQHMAWAPFCMQGPAQQLWWWRRQSAGWWRRCTWCPLMPAHARAAPAAVRPPHKAAAAMISQAVAQPHAEVALDDGESSDSAD